jgi:hypothetical protein
MVNRMSMEIPSYDPKSLEVSMKPAEQTATHIVGTEIESAFDISPDEAREVRLDKADCAAGRVIPHDVVGEWLLALAK